MLKELMKIFILLPVILCIFSCKASAKFKVQKIWATEASLEVPESVMYNAKKYELYVSNINGKPTVKDNNGYIAKLSLDGKILNKKWVTGLHAPKGMGIFKNILYVTDIDRVHSIDIEQGKILKIYNARGAKFLNDIAIDGQGVVYITDMMDKKIYTLKGDTLTVFLEPAYDSLNGLYLKGNILYVGTARGIIGVDIKTKNVSMLVKHAGGIDGLKAIGRASFIVSDWNGKVEVTGEKNEILFDTTAMKINAADFEYIEEKNLLLVPTFFNNRVVAYLLK